MKILLSLVLATIFVLTAVRTSLGQGRPNVILLIADDLNYDSPGFMGGQIKDLTPNLDRLASAGRVFTKCYNACSICGPSRSALMTGLYPQSNGDMGHTHSIPVWWEHRNASRQVTSMASHLRDNGYFTAKLDKSGSRFDQWDEAITSSGTGVGRDPNLYYAQSKRLIAQAQSKGKPFFLNINSRDPHEYWAGSPQESLPWAFKNLELPTGAKAKKANRSKQSVYKVYPSGKPYPEPSLSFSADDVVLPKGIPDTPELREQLKHYFSSVRRLDDTVGTVLQALDESGETNNTIVLFLSDNGLGWPFCKWTNYPNGTRTPLIVRWPGHIPGGKVDQENVVATVDIMPTIFDAVGLASPSSLDGTSLWNLLRGQTSKISRTEVFDCFNFMGPPDDPRILQEKTYDADLVERTEQYRPMRGLHGAKYSYIWNPWSNGQRELPVQMASRNLVISVLKKIDEDPANENHSLHGGRAAFYLKRVTEELYDTEMDPGCFQNLIDNPEFRKLRDEFRQKMRALLRSTNDHEYENFEKFVADKP